MQDKITVYKRLEENLSDMVTEEQAKLGYRKETIRLYYPLESLNHLFTCEASAIDMEKRLADFPNCTTPGFEIAEISHKGDRFCFQLAPAASEYVYQNREKNIFIYDLVKLLQQSGTTLQNIIDFFRKWDETCIVEEIKNEDFDVLIRFVERKDPYYYCFKDEGCHIIYHRFMPEDYKALFS